MASARFDRNQLLAAFDVIGEAAPAAGTRLEICVYGASVLTLASNFRFSTEDVDVAAIETPWPAWLAEAAAAVAKRNGWQEHWLNDGIEIYLSPSARLIEDHLPFGSFPRASDKAGLLVHVPTGRYILALKLRALHIGDPREANSDLDDVQSLLRSLNIATADEAIAITPYPDTLRGRKFSCHGCIYGFILGDDSRRLSFT